MSRAEGVEAGLVLDHALRMETMTPEPLTPETLIVMASSSDRRFVQIFEASSRTHEAEGLEPVGYRTVLKTSLARFVKMWNRPDVPIWADMNGDGRPELLLGFRTVLADRSVHSIMVCARGPGETAGEWRAFTSPGLITTVRAQFGESQARVGIYQEDKMNLVEVSGRKICLQGLSMGGEWRLVHRPDGRGSDLLGIGILTDSGATMSPHRVVLAMYRFTGDGYVLDDNWNGGRVLLAPNSTRFQPLGLDPLIEAGFSRSTSTSGKPVGSR